VVEDASVYIEGGESDVCVDGIDNEFRILLEGMVTPASGKEIMLNFGTVIIGDGSC